MPKTIITRADDFGSSRAANAAILEAGKNGFIRNVSLMAVGPFIEEDAAALQMVPGLCLGMHAVLNSEWDEIKWTPVLPKEEISSLLDQDGEFYASRQFFPKGVVRIEEVLREYDAQLDKLTRLGFSVSYVDSHMFSEKGVEGLPEAFSQWIAAKGLIDHRWFYNWLPLEDGDAPLTLRMERSFAGLEDGQYIHIFHPACPTEEMLHYGHPGNPAQTVRKCRGEEYRFVSSPESLELCRKYDIRPIRYDEATPLPVRPV